MKRHEALVPLSREHHSALILCQLLKKSMPDYKGLPSEPKAKASYAVNLFHTILAAHFRKEEELLQRLKDCCAGMNAMAEEIYKEHEQLTAAFLSLTGSDKLEASLNQLGEELEKHVRKEERQLFPFIEEHCPKNLLAESKDLFH